jgi:translation initiation factor 3 subunit A
MEEYLTLCVELKESHIAKDGLHQYKNIYQNVNIKSLEEMITKYLDQAEEKADKAKSSANNAVVDVDDLEVLNSPESLLLKAVSGESSQDRADRDLLAPWLKFVWESYKQCLDLLKNNNKIETLYQKVAKKAFLFCEKYSRKTEFRKLCETIRQHMAQIQKYQSQTPTSIDLSKPETQNIHLETRLFQLKHAISMQLWQEAYKAVEDIYALMLLSKSKPKPNQMFHYYSNLSLVFWKAGNYLFHAATLQKLFFLLKEQKKNLSNEELAKRSTQVLLATLSIPIPQARSPVDESLDADETTTEKLKRLSNLLNLPQPPTRSSLLKDLIKYNVIKYVYPEVKDLYEWLEVEFHPLKMSSRVNTCLTYLENENDADCSQYIAAIKDVAVMRLLKQISQVYTSIELSRFIELAPQVNRFHLEKLIVDAAKNNDVQVHISHQTKSLQFGNEVFIAQREDIPEGPSIQSMPSEQIRNQLITMSQSLIQSVEVINHDEIARKRLELASSIAVLYKQTAERQHVDLLKRKQQIEAQKELYEKLTQERESQEQHVREEEERKKREDDEKKRRAQLDDIKKTQLENQMKELNMRAGVDTGDKEESDKKIEQLRKERREIDDKLKKEEKKVDYFIRACHEVEVPLLAKAADDDAKERQEYWEKKELERIENLKKERKIQAENRDRLLRMLDDKEEFYKKIMEARSEEFKKNLDKFHATLRAEREKKLAERKEQRKQKRRIEFLEEVAERKRRDEDSRRARDDEDRRRKLDEQAEKQRAREREVEEKLKSVPIAEVKREKPVVPVSRPAAQEDGVWRRPGAEHFEERPRETAAPKASEPYRPRHLREQAEREPAKPKETG